MKDVTGCDKPRGIARFNRDPRISEWGNPAPVMGCHLPGGDILKRQKGTGGTETSKYPEEKKSTEIPLVAASEEGRA